MSDALLSGQFFAFAALCLLALGAVIAAIAVSLGRRALSALAPRARHRVCWLLAVLPLGFAASTLFAATLPSLVALVEPALDHCGAHGGEHAHLCFVHVPATAVHIELMALLAFVGAYFALRAGLAVPALVRAARTVDALVETSVTAPTADVRIIESSRPFCFAAGLVRPRIVISRGLHDALTREERAAVVAHERAHAQRRDALSALMAQIAASTHLPGVGAWLRRELEVAAEQCCDEAAAQVAGDRLLVASTILKVERLAHADGSSACAQLAPAFGACAVTRRVEALLEHPRVEPSLRGLAALVLIYWVAAVLFADELHHGAESALSAIAH